MSSIRPATALAVAALLIVQTFLAGPAAAAKPTGSFAAGEQAYVAVVAATSWVDTDQTRAVDKPALTNPTDLRRWTRTMTLAERVDLVGRLETQALYGETVTIKERKGDWVLAAVHGQPTPRDTAGYPGWIPVAQLSQSPAYHGWKSGPFALVTSNTAWLSSDQTLKRRTLELSFNTRLPLLAKTAGAVKVNTPTGPAWLAARDVHTYQRETDIPAPTGADLVRTAKRFVGLPYLWAGTSAFGFDCSGFTHTVYDANGITIPRDAGPQHDAGRPVEKADLKAGDLLFYAGKGGVGRIHHVGMYIGDGYEIDAPGNTATQEALLEVVKVDEHRYADEYAGAVRYLP